MIDHEWASWPIGSVTHQDGVWRALRLLSASHLRSMPTPANLVGPHINRSTRMESNSGTTGTNEPGAPGADDLKDHDLGGASGGDQLDTRKDLDESGSSGAGAGSDPAPEPPKAPEPPAPAAAPASSSAPAAKSQAFGGASKSPVPAARGNTNARPTKPTDSTEAERK